MSTKQTAYRSTKTNKERQGVMQVDIERKASANREKRKSITRKTSKIEKQSQKDTDKSQKKKGQNRSLLKGDDL